MVFSFPFLDLSFRKSSFTRLKSFGVNLVTHSVINQAFWQGKQKQLLHVIHKTQTPFAQIKCGKLVTGKGQKLLWSDETDDDDE